MTLRDNMSINMNVLKTVKIVGLHGHKNINLTFDEINPSIFIAGVDSENGI